MLGRTPAHERLSLAGLSGPRSRGRDQGIPRYIRNTQSMACCVAKLLPNPQPLLNRLLSTLPIIQRTFSPISALHDSLSFHLLPRLNTYRSLNSPISLRPRPQTLLITPRRPPTQPLAIFVLQSMRYAIRAPLLHILHVPPSLLGSLGAPFRNFQFVYVDCLPKCGQRCREEVGSRGELFTEAGC